MTPAIKSPSWFPPSPLSSSSYMDASQSSSPIDIIWFRPKDDFVCDASERHTLPLENVKSQFINFIKASIMDLFLDKFIVRPFHKQDQIPFQTFVRRLQIQNAPFLPIHYIIRIHAVCVRKIEPQRPRNKIILFHQTQPVSPTTSTSRTLKSSIQFDDKMATLRNKSSPSCLLSDMRRVRVLIN